MGNKFEETKEWARLVLLSVFFVLLVVAFASVANAQSKTEVEETIKEVAAVYGVEEDLALAIAEVESGLDPSKVGGLGELGVYQLRPEFHDVVVGDVRANATTAMKYLVKLQVLCADYGDAYFVCFNHGPYRRVKHPRLFRYYKEVMRVRQKIAGR